jgi:Tol biopolymer transport system component
VPLPSRRWRGETRGILLKDLDGGERFLVENGKLTGFLRNMSWTPDGRQLAYTRQESGGHGIWLLAIDDPSPPQPLLDNPWSEHSPRVSPDGRVCRRTGPGSVTRSRTMAPWMKRRATCW